MREHKQNRKISLKSIQLIVYDFDGVMTDNKVILDEDGKEAVVMNRSDGLAVGIIKRKGIAQLIISTERNKVLNKRAKKLKIPFLNDVANKKIRLMRYCKDNQYELKKTVYIGNDLNDLEAMKIAGMPMCPKDAASQIKRISCVVIGKKGGDGVVRELLNIIMNK